MTLTSTICAGLRFPFALILSANVAVTRSVVRGTDWLEERAFFDSPTPWLCGAVFAALLAWLLHDARA